MSAGNAVFVEALGLALVPLGDSLPAVRRQLAGKPVRVSCAAYNRSPNATTLRGGP